jgi:multidrug efflux system membrane fusion protein
MSNPIPQRNDRRKGQIVSACIVTGALISAGFVLRTVTLYPRTDDAEVTANFIGIAPVVEGPVTQLPIHDNDFIEKGLGKDSQKADCEMVPAFK